MTFSSGEKRQVLLAFVATQILPHEHDLRLWLRRLGVKTDELDDIVQEVYCRLLRLDRVDHISDPRSYLFRSARNIVLEQVRRNRVVSIMTVQNIDDLGIADHTPSPESCASSRAELDRVLDLIKGLPERCRNVFELRKVHGLSQAETARALSLTENVVEKETARGLSLILQRLGSPKPPATAKPAALVAFGSANAARTAD
ncbi:RNA polymerase sigma factor, sigma-70 family protein [Asticcacaulis biprosthecium C19]|uniref:RNA polymerase sigma factor, sigma-70 family protein n=1 Tax=Asticcacaulis biprosthecium C19 TaxID=715226 RepID=F4QMZ7_9CAUL|nr:sigma-70 family RNA polymerase sigma factor [Asticcacaulis biprosthecium]EGF91588.1 RNA polymerase sigma factor, sigma-70 family protein [Asticcacaulis biprosthecium C19]